MLNFIVIVAIAIMLVVLAYQTYVIRELGDLNSKMRDRTNKSVDENDHLVQHARRELTTIGEEPETIQRYLRVVQAFSDMDHSGGSAEIAIPTINLLLQYQNLAPLTNNPDEWMQVSSMMYGTDDLWQNRRNGEAFSDDGGKTYTLLHERNSDGTAPIHTAREVVKA